MKKSLLLFITILCVQFSILAQTYTTPNTGVTWTLDDIVANSPSTMSVAGNEYRLMENLVIAENDEVIIDTDLTLEIDGGMLVTVFGTFNVDANEVTITATNQLIPYEGFRFEEFSDINIQNATIEYGGGLRVLTEDFVINNCTLSDNFEGATTGGVISLSRGVAQITNNTIVFNLLPAISSGATNEVSPYIFNNYIEGNNQENSNRPQINLGLTRLTDTLKIIQNTIIGDRNLDMVGGIAVANFTGGNIRAIIDDNVIVDNRYGLTILGNNSFAYIRNNIIEDNDTQGDPNLGGSGISLNTSSAPMEVIASDNQFRRNLWGITVIGEASINLGDDLDNLGNNTFGDNGNSGEVYALYNNTANTLQALNNCWDETNIPNTLADAEAVIFHQVDDPSLGEVMFDPISCALLAVEDVDISTFSMYPNPARDILNFDTSFNFSEVTIYGIQGNVVAKKTLQTGQGSIPLQLNAGIYFVEFSNENQQIVKKLIVE